MKHFELNGKIREVGNKAVIKAIRRQGLVPCNLYGQGIENVLFTVSERDLMGITNTPASYIIDIKLDNGQTYMAVVHELQFHPVKDNCLHVDFLAVSEDKPIAIKVPIVVSGHPVGVQKGGKFVLVSRAIRISALMKDLPDTLNVDVTSLDIEKRIVAGDIKLDNVTVVSPKDTIICTVKATRNMTQAADENAEGAEGAAEA
ncbi:MAG: 50S ribosomal protein L25 [Bacteroidales bacterium]|nr:50S ribosomal protein L25 [Bacteroidales bacterium]MBO6221880.1 50S ribosomal protein L25 [Bacteroidales bacterium]MBQ6184536.1 50S ribosomal protein L25 [Bacteroidales bacterium]